MLGAAVAQCLILALALAFAEGNRVANRWLSMALVVIAGLVTPYAIGFAGFYDAFHWLTFAPFAVPLALGPLLYLYARALADGRSPISAPWHLALPAAQWLFFALCFLLPLSAKWSWYTGGYRVWVSPLFEVLTPLSLISYAWGTMRVLADLRRRLADQRSDDERFAARWLGRVLAMLLTGAALQGGFWSWSVLAGGINYFQETGLYLGLGVIGVYLGVAGWRHAALPIPLEPVEAAPADTARAQPDWSVIGAEIEMRVRAEGWWRQTDLTLPRLARLMGSNTWRVSRAVNAGQGVNFSTFVNRLRAEAVAGALDSGQTKDLLELALEMGFASKASFNRAFRARFGVAPSRYRRQGSDRESLQPVEEMRRTPAPTAPE